MKFDIRRQVKEADSIVGGVTTTSTAIETREIDLQHLNGREMLLVGGLRIEAQYRGFCQEESDLKEQDILTPDSGTTRYQVTFVQSLWNEHIEFFAKRMQ